MPATTLRSAARPALDVVHLRRDVAHRRRRRARPSPTARRHARRHGSWRQRRDARAEAARRPVAAGQHRRRRRCTSGSAEPTLTTDYRLATTTAAAGSVRIRVAPAISLVDVRHDARRRLGAAASAGATGAGRAAESPTGPGRRSRPARVDGGRHVLDPGAARLRRDVPRHRRPRRRLCGRLDAAASRGALMRRALLVLAVAALVAAAPAAAFAPTDPLPRSSGTSQDDHAFDAWAEPPTTLAPVKVAVVDSGVDCSLAGLRGPHRGQAQLRRRRPVRRHRRPRHVRRRRDRREPRRPGDRRHRVQLAASRREGRRSRTARSRSPPRRRRSAGPPTAARR